YAALNIDSATTHPVILTGLTNGAAIEAPTNSFPSVIISSGGAIIQDGISNSVVIAGAQGASNGYDAKQGQTLYTPAGRVVGSWPIDHTLSPITLGYETYLYFANCTGGTIQITLPDAAEIGRV